MSDKPWPVTGDNREYEALMRLLAEQGTPGSPFEAAVHHILKRLGRPDDEAAHEADVAAFQHDRRI